MSARRNLTSAFLPITSLQPQQFHAITHSFPQRDSTIPSIFSSFRTLSIVIGVVPPYASGSRGAPPSDILRRGRRDDLPMRGHCGARGEREHRAARAFRFFERPKTPALRDGPPVCRYAQASRVPLCRSKCEAYMTYPRVLDGWLPVPLLGSPATSTLCLHAAAPRAEGTIRGCSAQSEESAQRGLPPANARHPALVRPGIPGFGDTLRLGRF
jgi:hypothetical protein